MPPRRPATTKPRAAEIRYVSLAGQVAKQIQAAIRRRQWTGWLPAERILAESLQVSRRTIRNALVLLRREAAIETVKGVGHRILRKASRSQKMRELREVAVVLPEPLHAMRPFTVLWLDNLRGRLARSGIVMEIMVGKKPFAQDPARALRRLTTQLPGRTWLLVQSHTAMQRWFQDAALPCILAGSATKEIHLPGVDVDHRALCRHAVGTLWRLGHRRIVFLTQTPARVGDEESEDGFREGWEQLAGGRVSPKIIRFAPEPERAAHVFERLFRPNRADRPTGVIVGQSGYYLTVVSALARVRLRVPDDVSLIARDNESFFRFLRPTPAAYECPPERMAQALQRLVMEAAAGEKHSGSVRIIPEFKPRESVRAVTKDL